MDIYMYFNRVHQLHILLKRKDIGTPRELAQKLKPSERQTLEYVQELKDEYSYNFLQTPKNLLLRKGGTLTI